MSTNTPSDPESPAQITDFAEATRALEQHFQGGAPRGYIPGKTEIRDALEQLFGISAMDAETTVDELEARGFIRYEGDPGDVDTGVDAWRLQPIPPSIA